MAVRTMFDAERKVGAIFCDTSDWMFGPAMWGIESREELVGFIETIWERFDRDPRELTEAELGDTWHRYRTDTLGHD